MDSVMMLVKITEIIKTAITWIILVVMDAISKIVLFTVNDLIIPNASAITKNNKDTQRIGALMTLWNVIRKNIAITAADDTLHTNAIYFDLSGIMLSPH